MENPRNYQVLRGALVGVVGGLVASWAMNEFIAGPGEKLSKALQTPEEMARAEERQREMKQRGDVSEDATMKAADALVSTATGGKHLSRKGKEKGGPIVHYGFGALMGAIYGAVAEYNHAATAGFGTAFGTTLFAGADMFAVPALHLSSAPISEQTPATLATPLAAHLVYGATTEFVRRGLCALIDHEAGDGPAAWHEG